MSNLNRLPSTLKKLAKFKPAPKWTETFWCRRCGQTMSWGCGASDAVPDLCDECACDLMSKKTR